MASYGSSISDDEVTERAVEYMNKFVELLHLNYPTFYDVSEIRVTQLVEINCRLLGLNFNDYIPSASKPWEDVQKIIFSLQDRFGQEKFRHLSPRLIAERNPTHITCLLQIFNAIYDHGARRGQEFLPVNPQEPTILDITKDNVQDQEDSNSSNITEVSGYGTSASESTLDEIKFHFVLDDSDQLTDTEISDFQTASEGEENEEQLESGVDVDLDSTPRSPIYSNTVGRNASEVISSTPIKKTKSISTNKPMSMPRLVDKTDTQIFKSKSAQEQVLATGTIHEKGKQQPNQQSDPDEIERFTEEALQKLNKIRQEMQQDLRKQLEDLGKYVSESKDVTDNMKWNKTDLVKQRHLENCCGHEKHKSKMSPRLELAAPNPIRHDMYGIPFRERFPTYHGGIIKVKCNSIRTVHASKLMDKRKENASRSDKENMSEQLQSQFPAREIEKHLKSMEQAYRHELRCLKEEFSKLMRQGGHHTFDKIKRVWQISHARLQKQLGKIVDDILVIVNSINTA